MNGDQTGSCVKMRILPLFCTRLLVVNGDKDEASVK